MIIERDGKIYEQIISEREINVTKETYKLQALKDALVNDAREFAEYSAKITEIDNSNLEADLKEALKKSIVFYSPSGIKQEMVEEQEVKIAEINNIKK